jgi:hypothetical protein
MARSSSPTIPAPRLCAFHCTFAPPATWSEPTLLADRPAKVGGWSICYPTLTELPDGTLGAIWAQIKNSTGELYGDIHAARIVLKK